VPVTAVSAAPVKIYTPAPSGSPTAFISNLGTAVVYLGGAGVTPNNGVPLPPGQSLDIARMTFSLYAASGVTATATATTLNGAVAAGSTALTLTSGTGTVNGQTIQVGAGTSAEVVTITAGGGTTSITTTATQYDHASGVAVTVVTGNGSTVNVVAGTV
jgi:hypothetical protein